MIASTQITNTEIFAFIVVMVFKLQNKFEWLCNTFLYIKLLIGRIYSDNSEWYNFRGFQDRN